MRPLNFRLLALLSILCVGLFSAVSYADTKSEDTPAATDTIEETAEAVTKPLADIDKSVDQVSAGVSALYEDILSQTGVQDEFALKVIGTFLALVAAGIGALIVAGLASFFLKKLQFLASKLKVERNYLGLYARVFRWTGNLLVAFATIAGLLAIWSFEGGSYLSNEGLLSLTKRLLSVFIIAAVGAFIWEAATFGLEKFLRRKTQGNIGRIDTLLPVIRNILFVVLVTLFSLMILDQFGINIMPLLAGAGVLGIAIGFGAQKFVADFITGLTIIMEDLIRVGDVAKVGGQIGLVEKISIRKVQLRNMAGIVFTIPFSSIDIVENWTKDFSFYVMDIGVAYKENTDEVIKYLKEVDEDLRADEDFSAKILEPLEILGVDAFADSAVIIKARIKTLPIQQWSVGREFNRRMKFKFDEMGIEIPFPHQTIFFGEEKDGSAPAANILMMQKNEKATKKKAA